MDLQALITLDTWVTSDHHWEHPNIRRYQDRPEDHFRIMRRLWKETVPPLDTVLHLGDLVCFGNQALHPFWIKNLPGRKYLIRGNHDKHPNEWYEAAGFTVLGRGDTAFWWMESETETLIAFSHEPLEDDAWAINVHGHIHANPHHEYYGRLQDRRNVSVEVTGYSPVRLRDIL